MRIAFIAFTALISCPAYAGEWVKFVEFSTGYAEVNSLSIRREGAYIEAKFRFNHDAALTNPSNGAKYLSAEVTSLFDCGKKAFSPIRRVEYKGPQSTGGESGSVIRSNQPSNFAPIVAGSMNQVMFDYVCSSKHGR